MIVECKGLQQCPYIQLPPVNQNHPITLYILSIQISLFQYIECLATIAQCVTIADCTTSRRGGITFDPGQIVKETNEDVFVQIYVSRQAKRDLLGE